MSIFVGVDGGGTKTKAVAIDQSKTIVGSSETGSTNQNSVGKDVAKANLHAAISAAVSAAGRQMGDIACLCLSMSGVDCPADEDLYRQWTAELLPALPAAAVLVYNDSVAALSSGTLGVLQGMVVISGTGMVTCAFRDGQTLRAGGWGPLLGDGGSGCAIGSAMLHAVVRHHDGRGPPTLLSGALLAHLNVKKMDDVIAWTYADTAWARFAALAPIVFAHYETDQVAARIVDEAVAELVLAVHTAAVRIGFARSPAQCPTESAWGWNEAPASSSAEAASQPPAFDLVLSGGVLQSELVAALMRRAVRRLMPHANVVHPRVSAEMGSALLAWQSRNQASSA